ncbi:MAG: MotA/TolQ/ExbB proton channel family protein [Geovibrio sp.]|nr:MotA/TolQ/ExbB proton channel family protein [Geovibrio sp.]
MESNQVILVTAIIGAVVGSLGAVLGIINTFNTLNNNKVKMRVTPAHAIIPQSNVNFCIEVLNMSSFPITICEIGFLLKNGKKALVSASNFSSVAIPAKLHSRESTTCYFRLVDLGFNPAFIKTAYARTSCDVMAEGTSEALKQIKRESND